MNLFLDISQSVGLALAAGIAVALLLAVTSRLIQTTVGSRTDRLAMALAAAGGGALAALSVSGHGALAWPVLVIGAPLGALGTTATGGLLRGASQRLGEAGSAAPLYLTVAMATAALVAGAILLSPISYLALAVCLWLALSQRRRDAQKYAGLRILR